MWHPESPAGEFQGHGSHRVEVSVGRAAWASDFYLTALRIAAAEVVFGCSDPGGQQAFRVTETCLVQPA